MKIAFFGDVHGCTLHARSALERVSPFLFAAGKHKDHDRLGSLHREDGRGPVAAVDPFGAYRHMACGSVVDVAGERRRPGPPRRPLRHG